MSFVFIYDKPWRSHNKYAKAKNAIRAGFEIVLLFPRIFAYKLSGKNFWERKMKDYIEARALELATLVSEYRTGDNQ